MEKKRVGNCASERLTVRWNDGRRGETLSITAVQGQSSCTIAQTFSTHDLSSIQNEVRGQLNLSLLLSVFLSLVVCVCDSVWQILPADQIILPTHRKRVRAWMKAAVWCDYVSAKLLKLGDFSYSVWFQALRHLIAHCVLLMYVLPLLWFRLVPPVNKSMQKCKQKCEHSRQNIPGLSCHSAKIIEKHCKKMVIFQITIYLWLLVIKKALNLYFSCVPASIISCDVNCMCSFNKS